MAPLHGITKTRAYIWSMTILIVWDEVLWPAMLIGTVHDGDEDDDNICSSLHMFFVYTCFILWLIKGRLFMVWIASLCGDTKITGTCMDSLFWTCRCSCNSIGVTLNATILGTLIMGITFILRTIRDKLRSMWEYLRKQIKQMTIFRDTGVEDWTVVHVAHTYIHTYTYTYIYNTIRSLNFNIPQNSHHLTCSTPSSCYLLSTY